MARWWLLIVCPMAAALGATLLLAVMAGSGMAAQEVESIVLCRAPAMPIPDGLPAGVTDTLVVSSDLTLVTAEIAVTITQGWVGDLVLVLTRGEGEPAVTLLERAGVSASSPYGCGASLLAAHFTDAATGEVGTCTGEITGTVRPDLPLALLAGRPLSGSWQLRVIDAAAGKAATLDSWCLHAQASATPRLEVMPEEASRWVAPGLTETVAVTLANWGSATWEWGGEPAAAGGELLFVEAFEGSGMPPAGWELQPQLVTATWRLQQDVSHSGAQAASIPGSDTAQDEWLISPPVWLQRGWVTLWTWSSASSCHLGDACDLEVWLLGTGEEATLLGRADDDWREEGAWTAHAWELTPYLPDDGAVRLGLRYHGTGESDEVIVDDLQISGLARPAGCRGPAPPWLRTGSVVTSLPPDGLAPLTLTLDATELVSGTYTGVLCVPGNDPLAPLWPVTVTLYVDSCAALAQVAPHLRIARGGSGEGVLSWDAPVVPVTYRLDRGSHPYVEMPWLVLPEGSRGAVDPSPGAAAFYRLQASTCGGSVSTASNRVGWLVYELAAAAADSPAAWHSLSLALDAGPALDEVAELAAAIPGASHILRWRADAQQFLRFDAADPGTNFAVVTGEPVLVRVEGTANTPFTLAGDVADPGTVSFALKGGTPCRWNHLSLPLEKGEVSSAQALAEAIRGSDSLAVEQLLTWDAAAQAFAYWVPAPVGGASGLGFNFPTQIGGDYFACLRADITWP